jgi:hypothetical protein
MRASHAKDYQHIKWQRELPSISSIRGVPVEFLLNLCTHVYSHGEYTEETRPPYKTVMLASMTIATIPLRLELRNSADYDNGETFEEIADRDYVIITRTLFGPDWSVTTRDKRWVAIRSIDISKNVLDFRMVNKHGFRRDMTVLRMFGSKVGDWPDDG